MATVAALVAALAAMAFLATMPAVAVQVAELILATLVSTHFPLVAHQ